ncbi:MAG: hypothetical protein C4337_08940 [Armatimonadota bacterium]
MRRKQWLMTSALALVGANVVVLPHTLSAIAEWSVGGGQRPGTLRRRVKAGVFPACQPCDE